MVGVGRIAGHLLAGLGMAVAPASVATVQQHFDSLRALASGLALAGSGAGQFVLAQLIGATMPDGSSSGVGDSESWRDAAQALCVTGAVLLLPSSLLLQARRLPKGPDAPTAGGNAMALARQPALACVFGATGLGSFGMYVPFIFLGPFLEECVALSSSETSWIVSAMGLCNIAGRVALGAAADRLGRRKILKASLLVMVASTIIYPFCSSSLSVWLLVVLPIGLFSGSFIAMPPALIAEYVLPRQPDALPTMIGCNWLALSVGAVFGPPLAGLLLADGDRQGWHLLLGCATVSLALALLLLCCAPETAEPEPKGAQTTREEHAAKLRRLEAEDPLNGP